TVVHGTASVEWLEGERFLIFRARSDHPDFPDSVSIIGETDGLRMHYFDSRGVHRVLEMSVTEDGWEIARDAPEFSQRPWVTFADEDNTMIGKSKLSEDQETWNDDLEINYYRARQGSRSSRPEPTENPGRSHRRVADPIRCDAGDVVGQTCRFRPGSVTSRPGDSQHPQ